MKEYITKDGKTKKMTPQQERFCVLYASDAQFFGNGVQSYIEAYDVDLTKKGAYNVAKGKAYDLLTKGYILERINELFEARGLNDAFVDKQLEKLITQDADFKAKVAAIKEYNSLKARITKYVDLTSGGEPLKALVEFVDGNDQD